MSDAPELHESVSADIEAPSSPLAESRSFGYLSLRVAQYAVLFVSMLLITRALGPDGRAQYALPLALSGAVWVLTHFTLELAAARLLARREQSLPGVLRSLSFCLICLSALGVSASLAIGLTQRSSLLAEASGTMVLLASLTIPFLLASQMAGQMLIFLGKLRSHGAAAAGSAVVQLGVVVTLAYADNITPTTALAATLVGFAAIGVLTVVLLARETGARSLVPTADKAVLRPLVRTGAALHPASVAIQFTPRLDLILVAAFLTPAAAGLFSLALVLADSLLLVTQAVSVSAVPKQLREEGDEDAVRFTLDFARQSLLLTLFGVLVVAPLAYPFVVVVYGQDFAGTALPLVILLFAMAAMAIEAPCRVLLMRIASPWLVSGLVCGSLAVNVVATILLLQVLSISGAALAVVVAYWLLTLATLWIVRTRTAHPIGPLFAPPSRDDEVVRLLRLTLARLKPAATAQ